MSTNPTTKTAHIRASRTELFETWTPTEIRELIEELGEVDTAKARRFRIALRNSLFAKTGEVSTMTDEMEIR